MNLLRIESPSRILIIEDKRTFAIKLAQHFSSQGHVVIAFPGVDCVVDRFLYGTELMFGDTLEVDLNEIEYCFLDHYFEGAEFNGTSLTPLLVTHSIKVIGMSSVDQANASMARMGAFMTILKAKIENELR
jgi:hypothetical protein